MASIKLKEADSIRYSPMEREIFKLLKRRHPQSATTEWLTENVYKGLDRKPPKSSRIVVTGVVRSLIQKVKKNREPFSVVSTPAAGPYSIEVRIVE